MGVFRKFLVSIFLHKSSPNIWWKLFCLLFIPTKNRYVSCTGIRTSFFISVQSYKSSTIVNYDSLVVITSKLLLFTTLETYIMIIECLSHWPQEFFWTILQENDVIPYSCSKSPILLASSVQQFNYRLPYLTYFGGVTAVSLQQLIAINGFPNR